MNFRFARPEDAPAFAAWIAKNRYIPQEDKIAATKEANPTATFMVIEEEIGGQMVPRLFIPLFFVLRIAYCGFYPANTKEDNEAALEWMLRFVKEFAKEWFINQIDVLTELGLPMATWATDHGFDPEQRTLLTLKVNPSPKEGLVQ